MRGAAHVQRHASPLFESLFRHPRARADQRACCLSADLDRPREPSLRQPAGSHRLCARQSGQNQLRHQGKGQTGHLLGELLMLKGKFRMTEIPYRGSAPAINDLLAGNIDLVPDYLLANKPNIDAGKLKLLATGSRERLKDYPRVATIAETLPGVSADTWMAVAAPPGTPKEITAQVSRALAQGFQDPKLRARIRALEAEPLGGTP